MTENAAHQPHELPFDGAFEGDTHKRAVRIYFEDTDFSGVVYHASYLRFLERGRSDYLRVTGLNHAELAKENNAFAVAHMDINFKRPARIDDILTVSTRVETATSARLIFAQSLEKDGEVMVQSRVTVALLGANSRPRRIPVYLLEHLNGLNSAIMQ